MSAIEQDLEKLLAITTFTFDLWHPGFIEYFTSRTGLRIDPARHGKLLADPPNNAWRITRAKLQDCWRLFRADCRVDFKVNSSTPNFAQKPVQMIGRELDELPLFE